MATCTFFIFATISLSSLLTNANARYRGGITCTTKACEEAARTILDSMDDTVDPCDDFYQYACGGFIKKNKIPADKLSISHVNHLRDRIVLQLKTSLEEPIHPFDSRTLQQVKKYYRACMNTKAIENLGTWQLKDMFKKLGGWPLIDGCYWNEANFNWVSTIFRLAEIGFDTDFFFSIGMTKDLKHPTRRMLELGEPKLGLPRIYLVGGPGDSTLQSYRSYVRDILLLFGASEENVNQQLEDVFRLQIRLAKLCSTEEAKRNVSAFYHPVAFKKISEAFPFFPWFKFFNSMMVDHIKIKENDILNLEVPRYFRFLGKIVSRTPKRVLANYIFTRIVVSSVGYLPEKFLKRRDQFRLEVNGNSARPPRYEECFQEVYDNLQFGVSSLYVKKHFTNRTRIAVGDMVDTIVRAARNVIQSAYWMDRETKINALEKIDSLDQMIGYPDELLDDAKVDDYYRDVSVDENAYLASSLNIRNAVSAAVLRDLKKPVQRTDWKMRSDVAVVNAFYAPTENSMRIPAGILQGVYFELDRPNYLNFGGIGYVIGHEITHAFDDNGSKFDKRGNFVNWWSPLTKMAFDEKTQCMIDQYSSIKVPEVRKNLNGLLCIGENIADNGATKEVYAAYNEWVEHNGEEPLLPNIDLTPKQLFWVAAANVWCTNMRKKTLAHKIDTQKHSPPKYRVNVPLSNTVDFHWDFQCAEGTRMHPPERCSVW